MGLCTPKLSSRAMQFGVRASDWHCESFLIPHMYGFRKSLFSVIFSLLFFFSSFHSGIKSRHCKHDVRYSKLLWPFKCQFSQIFMKLVFETVNLAVTPLKFTFVSNKIGPNNSCGFVYFACMCVHVLTHPVVRSSVINATRGCCSYYTTVTVWASPKVLCSSSVS